MIKIDSVTKKFKLSYSQKRKLFFKKSTAQKIDSEIIAVNNLTLEVKKGEIVAFLGPNGAGKTTTIKIISTLLIPDAGDVLVNGYNVLAEPKEVQKSIGVLLTGERSTYWKLTAEENLHFFASLYLLDNRIIKKRIEFLLKKFNLWDWRHQRVEKFSSGMKQRLSLARALIHEPKILILDEPTLGIDPGFAREIRKTLRLLNQDEQITIFFATHYMHEAQELADRIAIINKGSLVAFDTFSNLQKIVSNHKRITIQISNDNKEILSKLKQLDIINKISNLKSQENNIVTYHLYSVLGWEIIPQLVKIIEKSGSTLVSATVTEPNLEDIYLHLTGSLSEDEWL